MSLQKSAMADSMGRVLIIAGSDSSGGAGIQADIKTVTMLGQYAASAITAITVQNTLGVSDVQGLSPNIIKAQIKAVLDDIGADTIKTGMLHSGEVIDALLQAIDESAFTGQLVIDPVMVATSGDPLISEAAIDIMRTSLLPSASVITPNIPEAEILSGLRISSAEDMVTAGKKLLTLGPQAVVMKGGHLDAATLVDVLITHDYEHEIRTKKLNTPHTHGTGCTFASAMAALLAKGDNTQSAFEGAHAFVQEAILHAPGFGAGHGPLGHARVREALRW